MQLQRTALIDLNQQIKKSSDNSVNPTDGNSASSDEDKRQNNSEV